MVSLEGVFILDPSAVSPGDPAVVSLNEGVGSPAQSITVTPGGPATDSASVTPGGPETVPGSLAMGFGASIASAASSR